MEDFKKQKDYFYKSRKKIREQQKIENPENAKENYNEEGNKNKDFSQLYFDAAVKIYMMYKNKEYMAGQLYSYLIIHTDITNSSIVISQQELCETLECTTKTLRKAIRHLIESESISITSITGTKHLYSFNPNEIWKSKNFNKRNSPYYTNNRMDKIAKKEFEKGVRKLCNEQNKLTEKRNKAKKKETI